jgi:hypothetical protein
MESFRQGLRAAGFVEGQNVEIELRYAQKGTQQLPDLAAEVVRAKVDAIFAAGDLAARVAQQATSTIPIATISDDAARAQQNERVRRIGVLTVVARSDPEATTGMTALEQRLHQLGWEQGRNVRIDYRWFAPCAGLVTLRQTFVCRSQGGGNLELGMRNRSSSALNSERGLSSIPMAQGGLSRLAIARLKSAGVPVAPLLKRVGLTPELIAEPQERLSVRSQIALLDEAAMALKDDCLGFTLARDHDPREIGLLYYVMASSRTLGEALKRLARYSSVTNEAVVFGYREGNRLILNLGYAGIPRHSDRHQIEFCMFGLLRICRMLTGQNLIPQYFSISHHRSSVPSEMAR